MTGWVWSLAMLPVKWMPLPMDVLSVLIRHHLTISMDAHLGGLLQTTVSSACVDKPGHGLPRARTPTSAALRRARRSAAQAGRAWTLTSSPMLRRRALACRHAHALP
jgi:hypothetical protein